MTTALGYIQNTHDWTWNAPDYIHFGCKICGERVGNSGVYYAPKNSISCFQPNCAFNKESVGWVSADTYVKAVEKWDFRELQQHLKKFKETRQTFQIGKLNANAKPFLPKDIIPLSEGSGKLTDRLDRYIQSRGFTRQYLQDRYNLWYVKTGLEYFGRIIFPYHNEYGELLYFQARTFIDDFLRWKNPPMKEFGIGKAELVYNLQRLYLPCDNLFINEGIFDVYECEKIPESTGTHTGGTSISMHQVSRIKSSPSRRKIVALDPGTAHLGLKYATQLLDHNQEVYLMDLPIDDFGKYDCSKLGSSNIMDQMERMHPVTGKTITSLKSRLRKVVQYKEDPKTGKVKKHIFHIISKPKTIVSFYEK